MQLEVCTWGTITINLNEEEIIYYVDETDNRLRLESDDFELSIGNGLIFTYKESHEIGVSDSFNEELMAAKDDILRALVLDKTTDLSDNTERVLFRLSSIINERINRAREILFEPITFTPTKSARKIN